MRRVRGEALRICSRGCLSWPYPIGLEIPETAETETLEERFRKTRLEEATRELVGMLLPLSHGASSSRTRTGWTTPRATSCVSSPSGLQDRPWLVVVTRRDQPSGFISPEKARATVIELEPLRGDDAAALLATANEDLPLPPHEAAALAERAGGNPFFLTELLAAARAPGGAGELPDSVEALMIAEIDRLSPGDRRVLRCASVIGASFARDLLDSCLGTERPESDVWNRLAELVVRDEDGRLRFRHALIRDAAYEGLPYRRRRELHGLVGETLERLAGSRPEDEAEHLSLHFFHAHDFDRAWRYSRVAGERAQAIYANVEAAAFFERALAAGKHVGEASRDDLAAISEALGDVRDRAGDFRRAEQAFFTTRVVWL